MQQAVNSDGAQRRQLFFIPGSSSLFGVRWQNRI